MANEESFIFPYFLPQDRKKSTSLLTQSNLNFLASLAVGVRRFSFEVYPDQGRVSQPVRAHGNLEKGVQEDTGGREY